MGNWVSLVSGSTSQILTRRENRFGIKPPTFDWATVTEILGLTPIDNQPCRVIQIDFLKGGDTVSICGSSLLHIGFRTPFLTSTDSARLSLPLVNLTWNLREVEALNSKKASLTLAPWRTSSAEAWKASAGGS